MDAEDQVRTRSNKEKLFALLREKRVITNEEARRVGGSRALGRINELKHELGADVIQVRKLTGGLWEIRYQQPALARSAETPVKAAAPLPLFPDAHLGAFQRG